MQKKKKKSLFGSICPPLRSTYYSNLVISQRVDRGVFYFSFWETEGADYIYIYIKKNKNDIMLSMYNLNVCILKASVASVC